MKRFSKFTAICFIIVVLKVCMLVRGRYLVEVELFGYNNPTQTCQDCRDGPFDDSPGCCDHFDRTNCMGGDRCDSYFFYCLRTIGSHGRSCSYFGNKTSLANIDDGPIDYNINQNSVLGLENPLQLQGLTDSYTGIQLYIEIHDEDSDMTDEFIDIVLVDHNLEVGQTSQRQNHTGMFGFLTVDLSVTIRCAQNFQGSDCTQCVSPGFTGPNCDEIDDCVGVNCGNGECVDGIDSFSCTCDPGFTGKLCQMNIDNGGSSQNIIGPIIGGVLGGLCALFLLLLLIVMVVILALILHHRKSEDKATAEEQGVKIVLNQLYNASPLNDNQDTDTLPYYEEVGEARSPTTQYVNVSPSDSSMRDSMLVNNPIYGDEEANGSEERFYTAPVDHDDQTSERHGMNQASLDDVEEVSPTSDNKHVYDYVDVKI